MSAPATVVRAETVDLDPRTALASEIDDSCAYARRQLEDRTPGHLLLITVPAPERAPTALLRAAKDAAVLWAPPVTETDEPVFAGLGCAHHIALHGPHRLQTLRRQAEALWATLDHRIQPGVAAAPRPRLFGGLAFEAGWSQEEPWSAFGDGAFTLPRLLYQRAAEGSSLTLAATEDGSPDFWVDELRHTLETLGQLPPWGEVPETFHPLPPVVAVERLPEPRWAEQVEAIREAIRRGDFLKIVAASRSRVRLAHGVDPAEVLHRLAEQTYSTRFAFFRPGAAFVGATPERLVAKVGDRIETEALAGSIAAGSDQAARLLDSRKDREEHELVVQHILRRLEPLCADLKWGEAPQVRELRNVLHLRTPIRGELRRGAHILDLVAALHPTPAVGGVPADDSIRWIVQRELHPRGWYAGPVGWFDAAGDGEMHVALRSSVLTDDVAYVYAGAGIMGDSDPHLEYLETELKERAVLAALGVGGVLETARS